ncbi:MAG: ATP-binding protein [Planctomycetia bacterium]|nr:ATP-binding protein [Planctomycetia bacterium]
MSHEIRTPLNAVIGFSEMLKDAKIPRELQIEYSENIAIAGNALLNLINDILDLSKLEAGQMQIIPERVDFPKYCRDLCRIFQYSATQKNLDLIFDIAEDMPALMLDQARMRQIFINLVGNSVKFTPKGGSVKITAKFSQMTVSSGSLLLTFADNGIGMPEIDQKKIFEPFVQLSKYRGTSAANNGTGLGLPIVRRLVDKMGGTLTVESAEGKGTVFYILLPNVGLADCAGSKDSGANAEDKTENESGSPQKINVLVVDDAPMNIKIFTLFLKRLGVSYDAAKSGEEALSKLKKSSFNWILTDLHMKDMSGEELAKIIRNDPAYGNIRIAVVTADTDADAFDKNLFDAILPKPIDRQLLHQCLFGDEK